MGGVFTRLRVYFLGIWSSKITGNSGSEIRINSPHRVGENPGPNRIDMDTIQFSVLKFGPCTGFCPQTLAMKNLFTNREFIKWKSENPLNVPLLCWFTSKTTFAVWQLTASVTGGGFLPQLGWNGVVLIPHKKQVKTSSSDVPLNCFSSKSSSNGPMILSSFQHAEPISSGFVSLSPTKGSHPYSSHEFPIESMHCTIAVLYLFTSILPSRKNIYINYISLH